MSYDAVIFDLFGTLVDDLTNPEFRRVEYERVISETAAALSVPIDDFTRLWLEMGDRRITGALPTTDAALAQICQELGAQREAPLMSRPQRAEPSDSSSVWGIHETEDVGRVVFAMVEHGILTKQDEDRPEDFADLFDFEEAFELNYPWTAGP